jgi:hypothetical protein
MCAVSNHWNSALVEGNISQLWKGTIMKRSSRIAVGIAASVSLGLAAAAFAHPGPFGPGAGLHAKAGMHQGMKGGTGPGATGQGPGQGDAAVNS